MTQFALASIRVALRFLHSKDMESELRENRLQGLVAGEPTLLYHGTTRQFRAFDLAKSRDDLVNAFYGPGIFLTPAKKVAVMYAEANRNIGFDAGIIDDLKRINPVAGGFLQRLVKVGDDAWEEYFGMLREQGREDQIPALEEYLGMDPNSLGDIAGYIIGSKVPAVGGGASTSLLNQSTGAPEWLYDLLDTIGLDSNGYRPKVYTVAVVVHNPLVTSNPALARRARSKGYDSVVFFGPHLVHDVPEVAVFSPRDTHIVKVEVI